jgi:TonB-dependent receptor
MKNMQIKKFTLAFSTFILALSLSFAQTGKIAGKVLDSKTSEPIVGASVVIEGTTKGNITDLDGQYIIESIEPATYKLTVTFVGYDKKLIEEVVVKAGQTTSVDASIGEAILSIEAVVVTAKRKQEAISTVLTIQKNSITVSDVLSGESIRRSPDRNVGDAIKRVSGVTIQDNKFPIIRGLNDRYNIAFINGIPLPSTEPDRRAFSFDIFPANLIDNIVVNKAATPDMPADFSGGLIQLTTKDIPDENFVQAQVGIGFNSLTVGKNFYQSLNSSSTDWLGLDNGARDLPSKFPTGRLQTLSTSEKAEASKIMNNDWGLTKRGTSRPSGSAQLTTGFSKAIGEEGRFGGILSINYSNNERITPIDRQLYTIAGDFQFDYDENRYSNSYLNGVLANFSYKINDLNKISFKNNYNISSEINSILRGGLNGVSNRIEEGTAISRFQSNQFLTSQLSGDHLLSKDGLKIRWIGGYNKIERNAPNWTQVVVSRSSDNPSEPNRIDIPRGNTPSPTGVGKQYFKLDETTYVGNLDLSYPFKIGTLTQSVRGGFNYVSRDRVFNTRLLGITSSLNFVDEAVYSAPIDRIFAPENFGANKFLYGEITSPNDNYTAKTTNTSAYLMFNSTFSQKLRLIWGARYESYPIELIAGSENKAVDKKFSNLLPSVNAIYSLKDNSNIRLSASQTVSRPDLRELAPFFFYDVVNNLGKRGNPNLTQTDITNLDLRYEIFPEGGQLFSISAFYKYFKNPIEEVLSVQSISNIDVQFINAPSARNFGLEFEVRKSLNFLSNISPIMSDFTVFGNLALINSKVTLGSGNTGSSRPLQGQSPYALNLGLQYNNVDRGFNSTLLFNQIGRRITFVGDEGQFATTWDNPRPVLDFQIGKTIFKAGELKFTVSDIFNKYFQTYQDINNNGKFDGKEGGDHPFLGYRPGTTFTLSLSSKF